MSYNIRLEHQTGSPLAIVRRRAQLAQLPKVVPEACGIVWNAIRANNIAGAGRHVAVYRDDVINLEVGVELDAPLAAPLAAAGNDQVVPATLPSGKVAATTHLGPYQNLGQAHTAIRQWCAANGHTLAGSNWDIYGHWQDAWNSDPSKIITDVYYLLV